MRPADRAAAGLAPLMRIECRRPAAWIALAVAAVAPLAGAGESAVPLATVVGGLLAVAAIGHLPGDVAVCRRTPWPRLAVIRAVWPVAGAMLAAGWACSRGDWSAASVAGGIAASALVAAALVTAFLRRGAIEWVAASQALMVVGVAAAAGVACRVAGSGPGVQAAAVVVVAGVVAGSMLAAAGADRQFPFEEATARHRRSVMGTGAAMASSLGGMAGCYFLAPQFAWAYALLAVGWFVVLAAPAVTPPVAGRAAGWLAGSAAGRPVTPGSWTGAWALATRQAGLVAWPAVVAAILTGTDSGQGGGPLVAIAALVAVTTVAMGAAAGTASGSRRIGDVARSIVLAAVATGAIGIASQKAKVPLAPDLPRFSPVARP